MTLHSEKFNIITFQQLIFALQTYWAEQDCVIAQPLDMEVGAGTFHPATFFGAIGKKPHRIAYVQASRRPTDGRYGENPNRLQHFYQFQVILKPAPKDIQLLYLNSLNKIGIDSSLHDIRFVEDNWESPTLGACGLGWEVWQNGMEISQFTYFQQIGGLRCDPITGEITYGLERIAMELQKKDNVFDIKWNDEVTYAALFRKAEYEMSIYQFEQIPADELFKFFNYYECESQKLIDKKLPRPAYEMVLKASHILNLLDARRAISVAERQRFILRVRNCAKAVASTYDEQELMNSSN